MPPKLERLASRVCSVCTRKGAWDRRGKYIICTGCGSEYMELRDELVLVGKMDMKTISRHPSMRRYLRHSKAKS